MIRVLTLNLRFGLADDGPNGWECRKQVFPEFFETHAADFIAFQEANDFQAEFLKNLLKDHHCIGQRKPAPPFWQDNLIFYRKSWQCIQQHHFYLSSTPSVPSRWAKSLWARQCIIGVFQKQDRTLIFATTHLDFDAEVQVQSAELILRRLAGISPQMPAILVGDFNALPESSCGLALTGRLTEKPVQSPCFQFAFKPPYPATHHGFTGKKEGRHIDWVLHRGGLVLIESRVIQEPVHGIFLSDHYPVSGIFKMAEPGTSDA